MLFLVFVGVFRVSCSIVAQILVRLIESMLRGIACGVGSRYSRKRVYALWGDYPGHLS